MGETKIDTAPVAIFQSATARSSWISGCGERFWNGKTSRVGPANQFVESLQDRDELFGYAVVGNHHDEWASSALLQ